MPARPRIRLAPLALVGTLVAAGLLALALVPVFASASPSLASGGDEPAEPARPAAPPLLAPEPAPAASPAPAPAAPAAPAPGPDAAAVEAKPGPKRYLTARVEGDAVNLRREPGGPVVARLGRTTEFGSPRSFAVVERRGRWLGVVAPELGNGEVAWIDVRASAVEVGATAMSVSIDLSRRVLVVKRGAEVVRRVTIGIGAPGSPTPIGRFAVTDKLPGSRYGAYYGCCILALSAKQPNLPAGWTGGDRIAVHGTDDPWTIGQATSAGCPHASDADLRYLLRVLPLGTPVFIHP